MLAIETGVNVLPGEKKKYRFRMKKYRERSHFSGAFPIFPEKFLIYTVR